MPANGDRAMRHLVRVTTIERPMPAVLPLTTTLFPISAHDTGLAGLDARPKRGVDCRSRPCRGGHPRPPQLKQEVQIVNNPTHSREELEKRRTSRLATPSDLAPKAAQDIQGAMNPILADVFALYVKTKNFHWHMSGPHFRDYHLLLDDQGAQIYAAIDPLAERVRKLGQPTVTSIGAIAKLASIKDNDSEYVDPGEMLNELIDDNKAFIASMRAAHDACDDAKDVATASILENFIDEAETRVWFLYEASRKADATGH